MVLKNSFLNIKLEEDNKIQARVINKIQGFYYVDTGENIVECRLRGILKKKNNKFNCIVGDLVEISEDTYITDIKERRNFLLRPIVANVDYMIIQFAGKNPSIDYEKINFLITQALYHDIKPLILINKIDSLNEIEIEEIKKRLIYLKDINIPLFLISAQDKIGIKKVEEFLKDKITVIGGPSGVGKSTLINMLQDEYILKTGEISKRLGRGKHTTRDSNMMKLKIGGYIIDTPIFRLYTYT